MKSVRENNLFPLLFLINCFVTFGFAVSDTLFSYNFSTLLGTGLYLSMAFTLYSSAKIVFGPIAGRLIGKYSAYSVLGAALAAFLVVSLLLMGASDKYIVIGARILQGAACALFRPVMYYMLGLSCSGEGYGRQTGLFDISFYSALAAGPFIGGWLLQKFGFMGVSAAIASCCIFAFGLFLLTAANKPHSELLHYGNRSVKSLAVGLLFCSLLFFIFFRACCISVLSVYLPLYMAAENFSASEIGTVLSVLSASTAAVLMFSGSLADNIDRKLLMSLGSLLTSFVYVLLPFATSFLSLIVMVVAIGFFNALSQPAASSMLLEHAGSNNAGQSLSLFNTVMGVGFACGPLVGGVVYELCGINGVFTAAGVVGAAASIIFFIFHALLPEYLLPNQEA